MTASRCVGVLLAGGAARRFRGMPKGLALVDGLRIADRVLSALRGATDRQLVVANDARAAQWFPGMRVVADAEEGLGPLHGLRTALAAAEGEPVLVVAWDMPFVTTALLGQGERRAGALHETLADARTLAGGELSSLGDPARLLFSVDTLQDLATIGGRLPDGEDTARR